MLDHVRRGLHNLRSRSSLNVTNEDYGLRKQASGGENPDAYVVAIHDLTGNAQETWTHKDGTLWLRDTLPSNLPNVEILSYGYNYGIFTEFPNQFPDVARTLLDELLYKRTAQNKRKPIVFICHGLGGILFKKSMILAHEQDNLYGDIFQSTNHVVFLGTPHTESQQVMEDDLRSLRVFLSQRSTSKGFNFDGLGRNAAEYAEINTSFLAQPKIWGITSFYETPRTGRRQAVIDQKSASTGVPNEKSIPLQETHSNLCRVKAGGGSPVDREVVNVVRRAFSSPASKVQEPVTDDQKRILNSLFLLGPSDMLRNISEPVNGTCDWLTSDSSYMKWMSARGGSLLLIEGPAGYGKSVLARYLKTHLENIRASATVCSFFCDVAIESRNHSTAMIRTILYQLMSKHTSLVRYALPLAGNQWLQDVPTLVSILKNCLQDPDIGDTYIIMDALDECRDMADPNHEQLITATLKEIPRYNSKVRVATTGRPSSKILADLPKDIVLSLDEHESHMNEGVKRFIHDRVGKLNWSHGVSQEDKVWLAKELEHRSDGNFLWVSTFLKNLYNTFRVSRGTIEDLLEIKPDVQDLYSHMLGRVPKRDQKWIRSLLQVIVASYAPLTVSDLSWHSASYHCPKDSHRAKDFTRRPKFEDDLQKLLGGIVIIINGFVYLEHGTVWDFLTAPTAGSLSWYHSTYIDASLEMARSCTLRLKTLSQIPKDSKDGKLDSGPSQDLLMYSLRFGARHIREAEQAGEPDFVKQVMSIYQDTINFSRWRYEYIAARELEAKAKARLVMETLAQNMHLTPEDLKILHNMEYAEEEPLEKESSPIRVASVFHHIHVLQALINESTDIDLKHGDGWTALGTAVERNQMSTVEFILNKGANVEAPVQDRNPLHYAVSLKEITIAEVLIKNHDANVDSLSKDGRTPLFFAADNDCELTLNLLIEENANIEHCDPGGNTVLHIAMSKGHGKVIRNLLHKGADSTAKNGSGKTPLDLTPKSQKGNVVRIMLAELGTAKLIDCHDRLRYSTNSSILDILVENKIDIEVPDGFVFAQLSPIPSIFVLELYLKKGVNVDETDPLGRTLLHRATAEGRLDVVEFLLDHGALVDKKTNEGDTALHTAVSSEVDMKLFQFLKDRGANLEARNRQGRTPFHYAVAEWHSERILVILKSMGADVETKDEDRDTPLQTAIRLQNAGHVKILSDPAIGANLNVITPGGHNLLDLSQVSFLKNVGGFLVSKQLNLSYQTYAYGEEQIFDDFLYQRDSRTVGAVMADKVHMIQNILNARLTPATPLQPTITRFEIVHIREEISDAPGIDGQENEDGVLVGSNKD